MKAAIRRLGNSQGVIIPKPLLTQVGLEGEAELTVENNSLVLRKPKRAVRKGWAQASERIAGVGDDKLVWPEFGNQGDTDLQW